MCETTKIKLYFSDNNFITGRNVAFKFYLAIITHETLNDNVMFVTVSRENQLKTVQFHLQRQLEQANKIITDKLPFIDTSEIIYFTISDILKFILKFN